MLCKDKQQYLCTFLEEFTVISLIAMYRQTTVSVDILRAHLLLFVIARQNYARFLVML